MAVTSVLTLDEALQKGLPFWRLQISNWGNRQTGADATSLRYPASGTLTTSPQLVAIGPDSTADEALLEYNPYSNTAFLAPNPGALDQETISIGLQKPGVFVPGPISVRTAFSTQFTDTYVKDGTPGNAAFGTSSVFEAPTLQLLVYPAGSPITPVFAKRNLLYRSTSVDTTAFVLGTEVPIAYWPVMGRGCKAIYMRATNTLVANVRIGLISTYEATNVGVVSPRIVEKTVGSGAINGNTAVSYARGTGLPGQWLAVYITPTAGAGFVQANLVASDEGCGEFGT